MPVDYARDSVTFERSLAGKHFVEHHAQAVNIRTRVEWFTHALLRRHVMRRADHGAGRICVRIRQQFSETEINDAHTLDLKLIIRRNDKNVFRLEIAVNHTLTMRRSYARTDPAHQAHATI